MNAVLEQISKIGIVPVAAGDCCYKHRRICRSS